jgi:hypothetical protein
VHLVPAMRGANVYLLVGNPLTLVDSGMPGSEEAFVSYVEGLGLAAVCPARVAVTHYHLDHVGSLAAIKQRTSAQVFAHPADAPFISGAQPPPPARSGFLRLLAPIMPATEPAAYFTKTQNRGDRNLAVPHHTARGWGPGASLVGVSTPPRRSARASTSASTSRARARPDILGRPPAVHGLQAGSR